MSIVTPLVSSKFNVLSDVFVEAFLVSTLVGDSVVPKRDCRCFPILLSKRVTLVYLV